MKRHLVTTIALSGLTAVALTALTQAQTPAPAPAPAAAQAPAATPASLSGELKQGYTRIKSNLTKLAAKVPDDQYAFKATPEIRSIGELIAHVADSQAGTCSFVTTGQPKRVAEGKTTKADLVAALNESFTVCDAAFDSLSDANATATFKTPRGERSKVATLASLVAHSNEEYGYLAVYLRLKGIVPPSSEK